MPVLSSTFAVNIISKVGLPHTTVTWQSRADAWVLTLVCKSTYQLQPDSSPLAEAQIPIHSSDQFVNNDPRAALWAPSDVFPVKVNADVLVVGHAFAQSGQAAPTIRARGACGRCEKSVEAGAAGGDGSPASLRAETKKPLIGLGPLAPGWPIRRNKLGPHAASWSDSEWQRAPLPATSILPYFNAAPDDQQLEAGEALPELVLENLHPQHPELRTTLAPLNLRIEVRREKGPPLEARMRFATIWIDTDQGVCAVTWQAQIALGSANEGGLVMLVSDRSAPKQGEDATEGVADLGALSAPLPFHGKVAAPPPSSPGEVPSAPSSSPWVAAPVSQRHATGTVATPVFTAPSSAPASIPSAPPTVAPLMPSPPAPLPSAPPLAMPPSAPPPLPLPGAPPSSSQMAFANTARDVSAAMTPSPSSSRPAPLAAAPAVKLIDTRMAVNESLQLLWFDAASVPRFRRKASWRLLLRELQKRKEDRADTTLATGSGDADDANEVVELLIGAPATDAYGIESVLAEGIDLRGRLAPPLCCVEGELSMLFDEVESLQATLVAVAQFTPGSDDLRTTVELVKDVLAAADIAQAPTVAERLTQRLRDAFASSKRAVSLDLLDEQIERALIEKRSYRRREVFDGPHIKGMLRSPGASQLAPLHLPATVATALPMFPAFKARLIAEVHPPVSQYDSHGAALRVLALGRITSTKPVGRTRN